MVRSGIAVELQPIDRLEEKIRQLVSMIEALRAERTKAVDDAARLQREHDSARARLTEAASASSEISTLREEREVVRNRVVQMLSQLDKLNL
jgi:regulator of replication initiation timing